MLPFLKPQRIATTIMMHKNKEGETTATHKADEAHPKYRELAEKILESVKDGNADALSLHLEQLMAKPEDKA